MESVALHSVSRGGACIRVHRFLPVTEAEGPGRRACLWVQGCLRRCKGCFNRETWNPDGGFPCSVDQIFAWISSSPNIEGVTFVGGEPFLQAAALAELGRLCQDNGLSVVTFTGYEYGDLVTASRPDWNALLAVTDLLLAGPYVASQQDFSRPWVGSRNQEFVFLSPRYQRLADQLYSVPNRLELRVQADGTIAFNGLASQSEIAALRLQLTGAGLAVCNTLEGD